MGDFNYNGEHSINISGKDTWTDWHLAPQSRPYVPAPPIKEEYVDVPGADGSLDYTEVLTGGVRYGQRTGQWTFILDNGYVNPLQFQSDILAFLHGKKHQIILKDDPEYYYTGRLTLETKMDARDYNQVVIKFNLNPYKYPLGSTRTMEWKWNDLFGNTIYYGSFTVRSSMMRNLINSDSSNKTATLTVSNAMSVIFRGQTINLHPGDNQIVLRPGDNIMTFNGSGRVTVDYSLGRKL